MSEAPTLGTIDWENPFPDVPSHLGMDPYSIPLEELNPAQPELFQADQQYKFFERLRKEAPIHKTEVSQFGPYWSVTRYEDIMHVDKSHQIFSSETGITLNDEDEDFKLPMFIAMDPPTHDVQRKTVASSVSPTNLGNMEALIRERARTVLDALPEGETFDWVETVSIELTTMMLATLFDFPFEDRRKLTRWSDITFAIPQPGGIIESAQQRRDELLECLEYFQRLKAERLENPGHDLVSMMAHGKDTKDLSPMEYLGNLLLLIVGGNDTTRNTMSGSVYALNQFPDEFTKLKANPDLIPQMVAEVIRWQTPLAYMRRTANHDIEIGGKPIKKNDQILMWYASGNRDEAVFEDPDRLDIQRPNARQHLSFGFGIHRCMGNRLAELQLRILWEELLQRFDTIEVQAEPERTFSSFVNGYTQMPVVVTRRS